jgi:hypothetical protein
MKNSLNKSGLSLSQAQSISNACNQRAQDINQRISAINNAEKSLILEGVRYVEKQGNVMPANIVELVLEKALLHATQAFLMENIKAKDNGLKFLTMKQFTVEINSPAIPSLLQFIPNELVTEDWGWKQLSIAEYNEYLEAEAYASHIGQFIHKDSKLDSLRKELTTIKTLEWMDVKQGEKTPMEVKIHHTQEQLMQLHEKLAGLHRSYEQKVNYFKAKVKNLVTEANARISKENGIESARINTLNQATQSEFTEATRVYRAEIQRLREEFEENRQGEIKTLASLRILVDPRFQPVVSRFLELLES